MKWKHVTAAFGSTDNVHKTPHSGIDMATPIDTPVHAITGGVIDKVTHEGSKGFGNAVWIREPDGYRIVFGHLDKVGVHAGERVLKGDVIALSGGNPGQGYSTGPHLHVGVMDPNGKWVNPDSYFSPWRNWLHLSSNRLKNSEDAFVVDRTEGWVTQIVKDLARDFGEWALHQIAPLAFLICAVSFLGIMAGLRKPRKWAFYSGLVATIGYRMGWSS